MNKLKTTAIATIFISLAASNVSAQYVNPQPIKTVVSKKVVRGGYTITTETTTTYNPQPVKPKKKKQKSRWSR